MQEMLTIRALVLCALVSTLVSPVVSDVGCAAAERFDEAVDSADPPATLLQEYVDITSASQCFMQCCSLEQDGCNTASFLTYGDRTVCIVARCTPFDSCTWVPFPHAVSAIIKRQVGQPSSATNATVISNRHDGADASGSDDATARSTTTANIHGDSDDLLVQKTNSNEGEEHNTEYDDEEGAIFDDGTAYDSDYVAGSESDSADGRAKAPEVQSVDKQQVSAWREVFNKPLVSIVSCIVVIFFLAVVVFLVRYLVGLRERAIYKPLIDRFTTVSYSD